MWQPLFPFEIPMIPSHVIALLNTVKIPMTHPPV